MAKNPLRTKFTDMMGIEFPILAFTHCKDVVAAVVNAGGFAVLGEAMHTPDHIADDIKWIRSRVGDKPFGIDLVLPSSAPPSDDLETLLAYIPEEHRAYEKSIIEKYDVPPPKAAPDLHQWGGLNQEICRAQLDVLLDEKPPVFVSGLGSPAFVLESMHERGMKVFGLVGRARQAVREIEAGIDVIIAQGYDAAGHTGNVGTFSIVPEVCAVAGDTPVIAAGGVTHGCHLAAALCLGAAGIWSGTMWMASRESDSDMIIKEKLLASTADDTVYSNSVSGFPMRISKNPWSKEWAKPDAPRVLPSPYQMLLSANYIQGANDNRREDLMFEAMGQGVRFVTEMKPAKQMVFDMVEEALIAFEEITGGEDED
jgi:NAD(P)H-dependent flavin oxidoreductase YrpB (nitropropane dioxygenase family)